MSGRHSFYRHKQGGFTLIEVMLVIVIMAVIASLVVMNVQGVDQRKVMQTRELLALDLQKIRLESIDQGRVLGLMILPETDIAPASYQVLEYVRKEPTDQNVLQNSPQPQHLSQDQYQWQLAKDFQTKTLPAQTSLVAQALDHQFNLDALKQNQQLPQVIWLGNGEMVPVRLQLYLQQQPIGDTLELNRLGAMMKDQNGGQS